MQNDLAVHKLHSYTSCVWRLEVRTTSVRCTLTKHLDRQSHEFTSFGYTGATHFVQRPGSIIHRRNTDNALQTVKQGSRTEVLTMYLSSAENQWRSKFTQTRPETDCSKSPAVGWPLVRACWVRKDDRPTPQRKSETWKGGTEFWPEVCSITNCNPLWCFQRSFSTAVSTKTRWDFSIKALTMRIRVDVIQWATGTSS